MTTTPHAIGHYSPQQVARLAGVSTRRLGSWVRIGIVPSISRDPRVYSYADAGEAVLARYLIVEVGIRPAKVGKIVERLRDRYGPWPLGNAPIENDGQLVVERDGEVIVDVADLPDHQVLAGTLIDLRRIRDALNHGGWVAFHSPQPRIEVDPDRHSGAPVVRGSRMPTARVYAIAGEPDGRRVLREEYGLTDEDIDAAVDYEERVRQVAA